MLGTAATTRARFGRGKGNLGLSGYGTGLSSHTYVLLYRWGPGNLQEPLGTRIICTGEGAGYWGMGEPIETQSCIPHP